MRLEPSHSNIHIAYRDLFHYVVQGRELETPMESHLSTCPQCKATCRRISLGLLWARATDPTHRAHADRISSVQIEAWLAGLVQSDERAAISGLVHTCPVCQGYAQEAALRLEELGRPIDPALFDVPLFSDFDEAWDETAEETRDEVMEVTSSRPIDAVSPSFRDRFRSWLTGLVRRPQMWAPGLAMAAALLFVILVDRPTADPFGGAILQEKGVPGTLKLSVEADIMVSNAQNEYEPMGKLSSSEQRDDVCPPGAVLRFRAQATGRGVLSVWQREASSVKLVHQAPLASYGGEQFSIDDTTGERLFLKLGSSGRQTIVVVLSKEAPPVEGGEKWLKRIISSANPDAAYAPIQCVLAGAGTAKP